jgi:hypothetical protein
MVAVGRISVLPLHRFTRSTTSRRFALGSGHWLSTLGCPLGARGTRQPETIFLSIPATLLRYGIKKGRLAEAAQVRVVKGIFPIAASLCTAIALVSADYFLQEPLYSFANDNPLEYGDLICFALLAVTAIKFIRE